MTARTVRWRRTATTHISPATAFTNASFGMLTVTRRGASNKRRKQPSGELVCVEECDLWISK